MTHDRLRMATGGVGGDTGLETNRGTLTVLCNQVDPERKGDPGGPGRKRSPPGLHGYRTAPHRPQQCTHFQISRTALVTHL